MEITRLQPFPLTLESSGFESDTDYVICILDDHSQDLFEIPVTSDSSGTISTPLPNYLSRYDDEYRGEIYISEGENEDGSTIRGDLVWVDTITIMRPYIDPDLLADTPEDLEEITMYESIARAMINSITGGFMYRRETIETVGQGADYLSLPYRLNKILQVYENNVKVYDSVDTSFTNIREYVISPDFATITVYSSEAWDRRQSRDVSPSIPASDSFTLHNTNDSPNLIQYHTGTPAFYKDNDYVVVAEAGWPIIPQDIKQAAMLIINDLRCNNIPYINSYISDYKSDQFSLKFDPTVFRDTGNRIVDKILSAYVRPIYRLGVL